MDIWLYLLFIIVVVAIGVKIYFDNPVTEGFTLRPYRMTSVKYLDNYPKFVTLSHSGGIKWVSNRPPTDSSCYKVDCPENIRGQPYEPIDSCWWCGDPCAMTDCQVTKALNREGFKNMEKFTNEEMEYTLNTDRRISAGQHIVINKFDGAESLSVNPPVASPGYKCVERTCPVEYNDANMKCWDCEVPNGI